MYASVIHFHVFFSGFSLKNRHFRQFTPFWRHFAPFCAISGYVRHLVLINILSNMCRSPTSASVFHFHVFFTGFSLKNRHFRQFTPFWRHLAPFPVMSGTWRSSTYHLTCVGDLSLLLFFICMCFSQVFYQKTPFPHIDATFASLWRHFRWSLVSGAHQCVGWYDWICFPEKKKLVLWLLCLFFYP